MTDTRTPPTEPRRGVPATRLGGPAGPDGPPVTTVYVLLPARYGVGRLPPVSVENFHAPRGRRTTDDAEET
ncbi:hypothetical protein [Streptomyces sp. NPDC048002]|uniref:hypothetical protein n=1 Tax=unclassified Streptomyces TaxID=2593676 RepID=UPI0033FF42B6